MPAEDRRSTTPATFACFSWAAGPSRLLTAGTPSPTGSPISASNSCLVPKSLQMLQTPMPPTQPQNNNQPKLRKAKSEPQHRTCLVGPILVGQESGHGYPTQVWVCSCGVMNRFGFARPGFAVAHRLIAHHAANCQLPREVVIALNSKRRCKVCDAAKRRDDFLGILTVLVGVIVAEESWPQVCLQRIVLACISRPQTEGSRYDVATRAVRWKRTRIGLEA